MYILALQDALRYMVATTVTSQKKDSSSCSDLGTATITKPQLRPGDTKVDSHWIASAGHSYKREELQSEGYYLPRGWLPRGTYLYFIY